MKSSKGSMIKWSRSADYTNLVTINNITYNKWCEIDTWCHDKKMHYTVDYNDWGGVMDSWWTFRDPEDAALFKLTWLG